MPVIFFSAVRHHPETTPPSASTDATDTSPEATNKAESRFKSLRPLFIKEVDKFDGGTLWRHKAFSQYVNGNGTTLYADIWRDQIRLTAAYQGSDWIFFKEVTVKANEAVIEAAGRPEHHVGGGVTEYLRIEDPARSQMIVNIYAAKEKPVEVRLSGKFYKDFTLKPSHKKAIQQTVEFLNDINTLRLAGKIPKGMD
jgi:hypothetical protein